MGGAKAGFRWKEGRAACVWTGSPGEAVREGPREGRQMPEKGPRSELRLGLWEEVTRVRGRRGGGWVQGPERRRADRLKRVFLRCV